MGIAVGTSVEDSPTIGETPCTGSRSIPMTSGLLGKMVLTFLAGLSPSGCTPVLFKTLAGLGGAGFGASATTSSW